MKIDFKDKKIAVIGEGIEGKSSAQYLKAKGAQVTVLDKSQGDNYLEGLDKYDLVVRSPGVKVTDLTKFVSKDKITSQTKLFLDLSLAPVIGVTGTKGKGTTSTLIYEMLKADGFDAYLGGNIGVPPFEFLDNLTPESWVVLEMSSFQLHDAHKSPHIAVMLMVTSEHLNYHKDVYEYIEAKRNILNYQTVSDFAVINRDYPASNESDIHTQGKVFYFSREREVEEGCFALGNQIILRADGKEDHVIDTKELQIRGDHNHENACAATMAAYLAGVSLEAIRMGLRSFKGLEHRLELVAKINDVEYFNDSIATTPESTIAAIQSFQNPKILILGGVTEGSTFEELGGLIAKTTSVKAIIGIGKEWPNIRAEILKNNPPASLIMIEGADNMEKIVIAASKIALPGDVVLLSPACKSFDMFKDYKDRGHQFKEQVQKLQN